MQLSLLSIGLVVARLASAVPTPTLGERDIVKRATVTEIATLGYASLNGGTTGERGGATTTVSTLAQYTAAVADDTARVVVVSGIITGATQVRLGSNKTVVGKNGSASRLAHNNFRIFANLNTELVGVGNYIE